MVHTIFYKDKRIKVVYNDDIKQEDLQRCMAEKLNTILKPVQENQKNLIVLFSRTEWGDSFNVDEWFQEISLKDNLIIILNKMIAQDAITVEIAKADGTEASQEELKRWAVIGRCNYIDLLTQQIKNIIWEDSGLLKK